MDDGGWSSHLGGLGRGRHWTRTKFAFPKLCSGKLMLGIVFTNEIFSQETQMSILRSPFVFFIKCDCMKMYWTHIRCYVPCRVWHGVNNSMIQWRVGVSKLQRFIWVSTLSSTSGPRSVGNILCRRGNFILYEVIRMVGLMPWVNELWGDFGQSVGVEWMDWTCWLH